MSAPGALRRVIDTACRVERASLKDLTVLLAPHRDPYRFDTPAGHRDAAWLTEHLGRLGYLDRDAIALGDAFRTIHLRGVHYAIFSSGGVLKPNGSPYTNTDEDWTGLQEGAARKARWLGYVPFEVIVDARNGAPVIHRRAAAPRATISVGVSVDIPSAEDLVPTVVVNGFSARQTRHLVLFGEKTGLAEVLLPVARDYGADLYLPSGEISDTLLYRMAKDGAEDGRPMVVFTFADCDPAGHQMSVSIGRKLQALRDLFFPALDFEVRPVALTVEQVKEYALPSTPLQETERRADRWRREFGVDQTEIDALAALRPDLLRQIARAALDPFFDRTLSHRVYLARAEWLERAQVALDDRLDGDLLDHLRAEASRALIARKSYGNGGDRP